MYAVVLSESCMGDGHHKWWLTCGVCPYSWPCRQPRRPHGHQGTYRRHPRPCGRHLYMHINIGCHTWSKKTQLEADATLTVEMGVLRVFDSNVGFQF